MRENFFPRLVEIMTTLFSWILLTIPFWGSFFFPTAVVYFIIVFDIYFLYKSSSLGINSVRSYLKIKETIKTDWIRKMEEEDFDYTKVKHIVFVPTYKEPSSILERTLNFLASQDFPSRNLIIVLAGEEREEGFKEKALSLKTKYREHFFDFLITIHSLKVGEVGGKSSNQNYAAKIVKKYIEENSLNKDFLTITSCDADVSVHPKYFANLTYLFLSNPNRYIRFWQGALVFYNNIWRVPLPVRVVHTIYSMISVSSLMKAKSNFIYSSYSGSWRLLENSGFWDPDVISEDWHLFFKAFFATRGQVELESIFLPLYGDAVEGQNYWKSLTAQYLQNRRWAWGVTDISYAIDQFIKHRREIPISNFILRFTRALEQHLLWPVNWWIITLGASLPPLLNQQFRYTTEGFYLPKLSGLILTGSMIFIIFIIIVDWLIRPPRPADVKKRTVVLSLLQYLLLPITGFLFGALPGMDAHTRVLFGKKLTYKVTEKFSDKKEK
jgi:cellulose synthase/poly-beta-1,6-N-acetylglucosamine synthase-like glycosyltransferase